MQSQSCSDPGKPSQADLNTSEMSRLIEVMAGALHARRELRIAAGGMPRDEDVVEAMEDAALDLHTRLSGTSPHRGPSALAHAARAVAAAIDTRPLGLNRVLMDVGVTLAMPVRHYFAAVLAAYADSLDAEAGQAEPGPDRAGSVARPVTRKKDLHP